jgi:hypothetical protein
MIFKLRQERHPLLHRTPVIYTPKIARPKEPEYIRTTERPQNRQSPWQTRQRLECGVFTAALVRAHSGGKASG